MQNIQQIEVSHSNKPSFNSMSLLDQHLPGVSAQLEQVCAGAIDLVSYAVRDVINQGLTECATENILSVLRSVPISEQSYTRFVLHADPEGRFTVAALLWEPTHSSPVHAHHTWCSYRVLEGELTESHYEWDATVQKAYLFNKVKRSAGQSVCGPKGRELIHRLSNNSGERAISIHTYGVQASQISTHVNEVLPWEEKV